MYRHCRTMLKDASIIILYEAITNVNPESVRLVIELLCRIRKFLESPVSLRWNNIQ